MKYQVEVQELLSRMIEVEADSYQKAVEEVSNSYREGTIVLDYSDLFDVEIG